VVRNPANVPAVAVAPMPVVRRPKIRANARTVATRAKTRANARRPARIAPDAAPASPAANVRRARRRRIRTAKTARVNRCPRPKAVARILVVVGFLLRVRTAARCPAATAVATTAAANVDRHPATVRVVKVDRAAKAADQRLSRPFTAVVLPNGGRRRFKRPPYVVGARDVSNGGPSILSPRRADRSP
jgi:hypothetical protein